MVWIAASPSATVASPARRSHSTDFGLYRRPARYEALIRRHGFVVVDYATTPQLVLARLLGRDASRRRAVAAALLRGGLRLWAWTRAQREFGNWFLRKGDGAAGRSGRA